MAIPWNRIFAPIESRASSVRSFWPTETPPVVTTNSAWSAACFKASAIIPRSSPTVRVIITLAPNWLKRAFMYIVFVLYIFPGVKGVPGSTTSLPEETTAAFTRSYTGSSIMPFPLATAKAAASIFVPAWSNVWPFLYSSPLKQMLQPGSTSL